MAALRCSIRDKASGAPLDAKVHVLSSLGAFVSPSGAILKIGSGVPFFYARGGFEVELPVGHADVIVERGTEFTPSRSTVRIPTEGTVELEVELSRWTSLPNAGWYPGNTHLHYDEKETQPDERLAFDAEIEDYNVTAISVLQRGQLPYASNKYAPGVLTELTTSHHVVDVGEESRHNISSNSSIGYGHVMFLNIRNLVEPVSRGVLSSNLDPDYPPLCWACDEAREQDGIVIWCHNGRGMEAPVAAVLGKLDAFNLFDPLWSDLEYTIYYHLLNAGIRLPASTGTDWFVCSSNRVYVGTESGFSYQAWLDGMKAGSTFITNGPSLMLEVDGNPVGSVLTPDRPRKLGCRVRWESHYPVTLAELVVNGEVAARTGIPSPGKRGDWDVDISVEHDSWAAARLWGDARNSFDHAVYAHTSPVYVETGRAHPARSQSARSLIQSLDQSLDWIQTRGRYATDGQRDAVSELFLEARAKYADLV